MMLFLIPVLALVRTTVDSEGTAAITENSEKDESGTLVRHTETETADPWDKWAKSAGMPHWVNEEWVGPRGWTTIHEDLPLVGITHNGWGKIPPGMAKTALESQEFLYEFACDATGQKWEIAWKTHWTTDGPGGADSGDPNGPPYAKDLAGNGLHVIYEKQGRVQRPPDTKSNHGRTGGVFPKEYTAWPSTQNVFNCPGELTTKISQVVSKHVGGIGMGSVQDSRFRFGEGVATQVVSSSANSVLVLGFTQNCEEIRTASPVEDLSKAPNCFPGKRGALLMHLGAPADARHKLEMDRIVMYLSEN